MQTVLIVIHLMIVIALVGVVLLQRSEGGGLGIGGGGGGGFMSARGAADTLTRSTTILGAAFFATSIALGLFARYSESPTDVLDRIPAIGQTQEGETPAGSGGVLDLLGGEEPSAVPSQSEAPAAPPAPAVPTE